MKEMKTYAKNIVLAIVLMATLIGLGSYLIHGIEDVELQKSTYTRTTFDFHIAAPGAAQVQSIEAHATVECVFSYYAYTKAFSVAKDVMLLVSDDIDDYSASVLTEGTLIEGSFDPNGAMLDKTAADALGVAVGDSISFNLLGQKCTKTVSAIYLPCTLAILEKGIVLVSNAEVLSAANSPAAYGGAFVVSKDRDGAAVLLSDYAGQGNVALTYEQYVDLHCSNIMPNQSQAEYDAACAAKYEAYRADILASAKKDGGQVVDKLGTYSLLKEKLLTTETKLSRLRSLTMIAGFVVFAVVSILFTVTNAANDRIRRDTGLRADKMKWSYVITALLTAISVACVVATVLGVIAGRTYFAADCASVILSLSLPVLAALLPIWLISELYVKTLYRNSVRSK